jgi:hypothetical protein
VDPTDANVVVLASQRGGFGRDSFYGAPAPPPYGVFRSVDGGASWTRSLTGIASALEVDIHQISHAKYAAIAEQRVGSALGDQPGASPNGVYRSTNGGVTWSRIEGPWGPEPANFSQKSNVGRFELAMSPSNPNVVYASFAAPDPSLNSLLGLFRTDDAWAATPTWIQIPTQGEYCAAQLKCSMVQELSVNPADPNTLFAAGARAWRCTNCATQPVWTNVQARHADYHALHGSDSGCLPATTAACGARHPSARAGKVTIETYPPCCSTAGAAPD